MYACLPFKSGSKVKQGGTWPFVPHGEVLKTRGEKELLDSLTLLKENRGEKNKTSPTPSVSSATPGRASSLLTFIPGCYMIHVGH